jgi:hypothetical protein
MSRIECCPRVHFRSQVLRSTDHGPQDLAARTGELRFFRETGLLRGRRS